MPPAKLPGGLNTEGRGSSAVLSYNVKLFLEGPTSGRYQGIVICPLSTHMTNEALQLLTHQCQWATCSPRRPGRNPRILKWALQNMSCLSILQVKIGHAKQVLKMVLGE